MEKPVLLKISDESELFSPLIKINEDELISTLYIKNKKRALRKVLKSFFDKKFFIEYGREKEKLFQDRIKEYDWVNPEMFFPMLERTVREYAEKKGIKIPLREIYIIASPETAGKVIYNMHRVSRLFTVIYPECAAGRIYDELYFKYGCIIRQLPCFNNDVKEECAVIRISDENVPPWIKCPVFDLCADKKEAAQSIKLVRKRILDKFSMEIEKNWGGRAGAQVFSLFGISPDCNARISPEEKADKIFLLDTSTF